MATAATATPPPGAHLPAEVAAEAAAVPKSILKESTSHLVPWFKPSPTASLTPEIQSFFQTYAGIEPQDLESHLLTIRERAWQTCPYPCVGAWGFLHPLIKMLPTYPTIVEKLRGSGSFVDLGCCFGEEMRWLAADGAPTERMIGIDLKEQFWEFGFDLFRDTNSMNAKFLKGDIFDSNDEHLNALQGQADVVFAGNFFHLFSREGQLEAMERTVSWSRGPGSVICGLHIGATEARALTSDWKRGPGKSEQYYHNAESWRQFWNEIEERTGTKWNVQVWAQRMVDISQKHSWMGERATRFRFHCTREM